MPNNFTWSKNDDAHYHPVNIGGPSTLPPGAYTVEIVNNQAKLIAKSIITDELVVFPDDTVDNVLQEIDNFSKLKDNFTKYNFIYKRGVLLYGPAGSGKTTIINLLVDLITKQGGVALFIDHPGIASIGFNMIRSVEPDRTIIAIMEDIDLMIDCYDEAGFLSLLDGENQINNVIFVATTNNIEALKERVSNRPSRFDTVKYVGMPNDKAREAYFKAKIPDITAKELNEYVTLSLGYSVAHMKELIVLTKCFNIHIKDAKVRIDQAGKLVEHHVSLNKQALDKPATLGYSVNHSNLNNVPRINS